MGFILNLITRYIILRLLLSQFLGCQLSENILARNESQEASIIESAMNRPDIIDVIYGCPCPSFHRAGILSHAHQKDSCARGIIAFIDFGDSAQTVKIVHVVVPPMFISKKLV